MTIVEWVFPTVASKQDAQTPSEGSGGGNITGTFSKTYNETAMGTNTPLNPGVAGEWGNYGITYCGHEDMS